MESIYNHEYFITLKFKIGREDAIDDIASPSDNVREVSIKDFDKITLTTLAKTCVHKAWGCNKDIIDPEFSKSTGEFTFIVGLHEYETREKYLNNFEFLMEHRTNEEAHFQLRCHDFIPVGRITINNLKLNQVVE